MRTLMISDIGEERNRAPNWARVSLNVRSGSALDVRKPVVMAQRVRVAGCIWCMIQESALR
jgi:hypothetical protein